MHNREMQTSRCKMNTKKSLFTEGFKKLNAKVFTNNIYKEVNIQLINIMEHVTRVVLKHG